MLEGVPLDLGNWSAVGILALVVLMIITGRGLATRREVNVYKEIADKWQTVAETSLEANREKDHQFAELLENSRITVKLLRSIPADRGGGDLDDVG